MKNMTGYDVIFSNPPYQEQSEAQKNRVGGGSVQAKPIYHKIIEYVIDELKPHYISMITPSRWMVGGMGLKKFRERMLNDKRLRLIQDFPGPYSVFNNVKIESGVNYFLWDRDYDGLCEFNGYQRYIGEFDVLVRNNIAHQILKKVLSKTTKFCNERVLPVTPFGIYTNFNNWSEKEAGTVKCIARGHEERYINAGLFSDEFNALTKWKVCSPKAYGEDTSGDKLIYNLKGAFILEPGALCTQTYIVLSLFKTKKEAVNFLSYTSTKFFRMLLGMRKVSQDINRDKFSWVPDMGDYSITYTDQELYQHFGLTKKEENHIEKTIKSI